MDEKVVHQEKQHRFVLAIDGEEAELTYRRMGHTLIVNHTGVPAALQHRGLANLLAEAALSYAREHKLTVDPQCRFMAVYLKRHPQP